MRNTLVMAHIQLAAACMAREITFDQFESVARPLGLLMSREELEAARYQAEAVRVSQEDKDKPKRLARLRKAGLIQPSDVRAQLNDAEWGLYRDALLKLK